MNPRLTFHGAAGCVTGFCARLETEQATILIDCGLFQGSKSLKALNYEDFPFNAASVDAVLLTHAHIDHSGLLPKLMKAGFRGPIYATAATRDLCAVMLADAGGIQEAEVQALNRRNQRRGRAVVEPIYTARDAARVMRRFERIKLGETVAIAPGLSAVYWEAGHILGSASIMIDIEGAAGRQRLLFSGDLGSGGSEFLPDPDGPEGVNHLIVESTYGDRERAVSDGPGRRRLLAEQVRAAHAAGGPLLIPAFAVERSQELLIDLLALMEAGEIPESDIFLDSPLAIEACEVFLERGWNPVAGDNPFAPLRPSARLHFVDAPQDSDRLEQLKGWHILLAGSGMCDAGRIRKHLKRLLWRQQTTVLLCGFQAAGTLGRLLADGAERVSIQGDEIKVRARIARLDVYSAHADGPALANWVQARGPVAGGVFLAHGEPEGAAGLQARLTACGLDAGKIAIPELDDCFELTPTGLVALKGRAPRLAPRVATQPDWHNERAAFQIALGAALDRAKDDAARKALLARLQATLASA